MATNVVRDGWKRDGRAERLLDTPGLAATATPAPDPQAGLEQAERTLLARRMLARVSDRERTILLMWVEGFAHKEIAEVVGTTAGTIGPTIARALKKLSKQIDQSMREDV